MRRLIFLFLLVVSFAAHSGAQNTTTPNTGMKLVNRNLTTNWDTYLNGNFSFLDSYVGGVSTLAVNSATPSVNSTAGLNGIRNWQTANTTATAITNFANGFPGQQITMICNDSVTTLNPSVTLALITSFSCGSLAKSISLVLVGAVWTEVARGTPTTGCTVAGSDTQVLLNQMGACGASSYLKVDYGSSVPNLITPAVNGVVSVDGSKYLVPNDCINGAATNGGICMIPANVAAAPVWSLPPNNVMIEDLRFNNSFSLYQSTIPEYSHIYYDFHAGAASPWETSTGPFSGIQGIEIDGYADAGGNGSPGYYAVVPFLAASYRTGGARPIWGADFSAAYANNNNTVNGVEIDMNNQGTADLSAAQGFGINLIGAGNHRNGMGMQIGRAGTTGGFTRGISIADYSEDGILFQTAETSRTADAYFVPPSGLSGVELIGRDAANTNTLWSIADTGAVSTTYSLSAATATKSFGIVSTGQIQTWGLVASPNESALIGIDSTHGMSIGPNTNLNNGSISLSISPAVAGNVAIRIAGQPSQRGDLQDWTNSGQTVLSKVDKDGNLTVPLCTGCVITASLSTSAATSDNVTVSGMTTMGHCQLTPTSASAATNYRTTYVSAKATNQITVTHAATSGMTYDVACTPN
jgi:hypothetical protein